MQMLMEVYPDRLDPEKHKWMNSPAICFVKQVIRSKGGIVRVVGGAVRDALLGLEVHDIDLAVNFPPEKVSTLLSQAGIKVVPTGIEHGTITAIIDRKGYEITTLRQDIQTDGRHAQVTFTDDWCKDAARRDFTFNALYLDEEGKILDYFGGKEDLAARCVRFIGDPKTRITEDFLRLLRAFRFMAQLSGPQKPAFIESESLKACIAFAGQLKGLSAERIWRELSRMLVASDILPACTLMLDKGVLEAIFPQIKNLSRLERLVAVEESVDAVPDALLRLAALVEGSADEARTIGQNLRLSRRDQDHLILLGRGMFAGVSEISYFIVRQRLYDFGARIVFNALLLEASERDIDLCKYLCLLKSWEKPIFPVQGKDLLALGLSAGPKLGQILKLTEGWWRENDFKPTRLECINYLRSSYL